MSKRRIRWQDMDHNQERIIDELVYADRTDWVGPIPEFLAKKRGEGRGPMTYIHPEDVIINPPSSFTGKILDLQVGGGTKLFVDEQGRLCRGLTNEKRIESIGNWLVVTNQNSTQGVIALDVGGGGSLLVRRKTDYFELLRAKGHDRQNVEALKALRGAWLAD